jgi:aspartyl-tRNA(Asn)/glutamyl-tRNA(Gln) amidotransferase subunit C
MPHLSPDDLDRVAALAHLRLAPEQRTRLMADLERILDYVDQLAAIDTEGVDATAHVSDAARSWRPDEPMPSLPVPEAIGNAPDADATAGVFRVPRVVG